MKNTFLQDVTLLGRCADYFAKWVLVILPILYIASTDVHAQKKKSSRQSLAKADSLFMLRDYSAAIALYEALVKDPAHAKNAQVWFRLGNSYHNLKKYDDALRPYEQAQKINSRTPSLALNMAKVYSATNRIDKSFELLDTLMAVGFGNYKVLENDPEFDNLRKTPGFKAVRDSIFGIAFPCLKNPKAREFDFWLGDWDVYVTANLNIKAGFNRITQASGGCVIVENWESAGPHSGMSINYFEPRTAKWQQKWAGSGPDIIEFYDGEYSDQAMRFKWEGVNPDGTKFMGKLTFTELAPGKVTQHSQRSNDGGKTWQDVYNFTYIRRN